MPLAIIGKTMRNREYISGVWLGTELNVFAQLLALASLTTVNALECSTVTVPPSTTTIAQEFTVAPWLQYIDQRTIEQVRSIIISSEIHLATFTFVVPAPTQALVAFGGAGCIAPL